MKKEKKEEKREETNEKVVNENKEVNLEGQIKSENKILKVFIISIISFAILFVIGAYVINSFRSFEYKGVEFSTIKEGDITFYETSIPVKYKDGLTGDIVSADYNFYVRNDPRKMEEKVPLNGGDIVFRKNIVLDLTTEELFCEGDWSLAQGNLMELGSFFGITLLVKNESIEYSPNNEYMFLTINEADVTEIRKIDENHYEMNVNNCEVLAAAERILIEAIVSYNKF